MNARRKSPRPLSSLRGRSRQVGQDTAANSPSAPLLPRERLVEALEADPAQWRSGGLLIVAAEGLPSGVAKLRQVFERALSLRVLWLDGVEHYAAVVPDLQARESLHAVIGALAALTRTGVEHSESPLTDRARVPAAMQRVHPRCALAPAGPDDTACALASRALRGIRQALERCSPWPVVYERAPAPGLGRLLALGYVAVDWAAEGPRELRFAPCLDAETGLLRGVMVYPAWEEQPFGVVGWCEAADALAGAFPTSAGYDRLVEAVAAGCGEHLAAGVDPGLVFCPLPRDVATLPDLGAHLASALVALDRVSRRNLRLTVTASAVRAPGALGHLASVSQGLGVGLAVRDVGLCDLPLVLAARESVTELVLSPDVLAEPSSTLVDALATCRAAGVLTLQPDLVGRREHVLALAAGVEALAGPLVGRAVSPGRHAQLWRVRAFESGTAS